MATKKKLEPKLPNITRAEFLAHAKQVTLELPLSPKLFSTGSVGLNANGRFTEMVNGKALTCQLGANLTVIDTKELKDEQKVELLDKMKAEKRSFVLNVKEFSTGSIGWNATGKDTIKLNDGTDCRCQVSINFTVNGSKYLPKTEAAAA